MADYRLPPDVGRHIAKLERRIAELERRGARSWRGAVEGFSGRANNNTNPAAGEYDWTGVGLGDIRLDTNGSHGNQFDPTWTTHRDGWYLVTVLQSWDVNPSGLRGAKVTAPGRTLVIEEVNATAGSHYTQSSGDAAVYLAAGTVLTFSATQTGSGAIVSHKNDANAQGSGFDAIYLGP